MIHVIITGLPSIAKAVASAMSQTVMCKIWAIEDNSEVERYEETKDELIYYRKGRHYKAANIWHLLDYYVKAQPEDVVCLLDGDDTFKNRHALEPIVAAYHHPGIWLTYGSYDKLSGDGRNFNGPYRGDKPVRKANWHATHLKTFKFGLWEHLPKRCLMDSDGHWLKVCSDTAIMYPLIEMAGYDRTKYIKQTIYTYNDDNPDNDHKTMPEEQLATDKWLRSQEPFKRLESL
jgi:hypothetical protein